jgi:hypothetical protein
MGERMSTFYEDKDDDDDDVAPKPHEESSNNQYREQEASLQQVEVNQPEEHVQQSVRRSDHPSRTSKQWWVVQQPSANIAITDGLYVPASYKQAMHNDECDRWRAAIDTEYKSL